MKVYKLQDSIINLNNVALVSIRKWNINNLLVFYFDRKINGDTNISFCMKSEDEARDTLLDIYTIMKEK